MLYPWPTLHGGSHVAEHGGPAYEADFAARVTCALCCLMEGALEVQARAEGDGDPAVALLEEASHHVSAPALSLLEKLPLRFSKIGVALRDRLEHVLNSSKMHQLPGIDFFSEGSPHLLTKSVEGGLHLAAREPGSG